GTSRTATTLPRNAQPPRNSRSMRRFMIVDSPVSWRMGLGTGTVSDGRQARVFARCGRPQPACSILDPPARTDCRKRRRLPATWAGEGSRPAKRRELRSPQTPPAGILSACPADLVPGGQLGGGKVFAKLFATLFPGGKHFWRT